MKSIFDEWEQKIDYRLFDHMGGYCARGWIRRYYGQVDILIYGGKNEWAVLNAECRIGGYIIKHFPVPWLYSAEPGDAIAWANNQHILSIEDFRAIDILTAEAMQEEPVDPQLDDKQEPAPVEQPDEVPELEPVA